jgi:hypothetical protein
MDALQSKYPELSADRYEHDWSISSLYTSINIFKSTVRTINYHLVLAQHFASASQTCRMAESFCELTFAISKHSNIVNDDDPATVSDSNLVRLSIY